MRKYILLLVPNHTDHTIWDSYLIYTIYCETCAYRKAKVNSTAACKAEPFSNHSVNTWWWCAHLCVWWMIDTCVKGLKLSGWVMFYMCLITLMANRMCCLELCCVKCVVWHVSWPMVRRCGAQRRWSTARWRSSRDMPCRWTGSSEGQMWGLDRGTRNRD
jgi:hypothetical protein